MGNRRFEMHQYRQVIYRMRQGAHTQTGVALVGSRAWSVRARALGESMALDRALGIAYQRAFKHLANGRLLRMGLKRPKTKMHRILDVCLRRDDKKEPFYLFSFDF